MSMCKACQRHLVMVAHAERNLVRLARRASRDESPRNLTMLAHARAEVDDAKRARDQHVEDCRERAS